MWPPWLTMGNKGMIDGTDAAQLKARAAGSQGHMPSHQPYILPSHWEERRRLGAAFADWEDGSVEPEVSEHRVANIGVVVSSPCRDGEFSRGRTSPSEVCFRTSSMAAHDQELQRFMVFVELLWGWRSLVALWSAVELCRHPLLTFQNTARVRIFCLIAIDRRTNCQPALINPPPRFPQQALPPRRLKICPAASTIATTSPTNDQATHLRQSNPQPPKCLEVFPFAMSM